MAYNPYGAVKSISELKGKYHTAKQLGGDYNRYQDEAVKYYKELADNGMDDLANELAANNYIGSLDILARYKPDQEYDTSNMINAIQGAQGIATGKNQAPVSNAVHDIMGSFAQNDNLLNGELRYDTDGNVIGGLNVDHYNTGKNQLGYINDFDYTKQSYYDPIMQSFQLKGQDASKGELAGGGSANSGNIDSYAAANANRQQLAFTAAGHEAAQANARQQQQAWQNLYDSMGGHLTNMGTINAQNLATGSKYYATDSAERQNALNNLAMMVDNAEKRDLEKYLAGLSSDTTRYGVDAEKEIAGMNNEAALNQLIQRLSAERDIAGMKDATNRYSVDAEKEIANAKNQNEIDKIIKEYEMKMQAIENGVPSGDETDPDYNTMYRDLNDMIAMMRGGETSLKSYNDVYQAALELYPDKAKEISSYIDNIIKNDGSNNLLTMIN